MYHSSSTPRIAASLGAGVLVLLVLSGTPGTRGGDDYEVNHLDVGSSTHGTDAVLQGADLRLSSSVSYEVAGSVEASRIGCLFDPRYLPHTPDAVEGWYRSCASVAKRVRCRLDQQYLPHTPDAVEGWYRRCS